MNLELNKSIVLIYSNNEVNKVIGTGFIIHQDTNGVYLLTCFHVVDDIDGPDDIMVDGVPAVMIANDNKDGFDLAVLKVKGLWDKPILKLSSFSEEKRLFIGFGYSSEAEVSTMMNFSGFIDQKMQIRSKKLNKQTNAWSLVVDPENPLKDGNSGSPIIDLVSKSVLGVVTTKKKWRTRYCSLC